MTIQALCDRRASARGYTLIEMLIVITIIGIIAAIGAPPIVHMIKKYQVIGFARSVDTLAKKTRLQAIRKGRRAVIVFDEGEHTITATVDGGDRIGKIGMPGYVRIEAPTDEDAVVGLDDIAGPPRQVRVVFNNDGSAEAIGAVRFGDKVGHDPIPPEDERNFIEISIGPTRAIPTVRLRKWDGTEWWGKGEGDTTEGGGAWIWR